MAATPPTLAALLLAASTASATITIPTVSVGDAGNAADPATGNEYGDVAYEYQIGKHEVTNSQYTAFLNAVAKTDTHSLWNSKMGSNGLAPYGGITRQGSRGNYSYSTKPNMANKPVNYVSFWDATRFANWLTNGQPEGSQNNNTTETGAYTLTNDGIDNNTVTRGSWYAANVGNISDKTVFAVPSEDEWYKAAYYDGSGGYYLYPTESDNKPPKATANGIGDVSNPLANPANYGEGANWDNSQNGNVTTVGSAEVPSHYGTFDQAGNVIEWNDTKTGASNRGQRGGSFRDDQMDSLARNEGSTIAEHRIAGFRVSSFAPIPEPSSYGAIFGIVGLATAVFFRRRRHRE